MRVIGTGVLSTAPIFALLSIPAFVAAEVTGSQIVLAIAAACLLPLAAVCLIGIIFLLLELPPHCRRD